MTNDTTTPTGTPTTAAKPETNNEMLARVMPTEFVAAPDTTISRWVYLGRTADRSRVFADVRLTTRHAQPGQRFTTTGHESITEYVEFAASFEVVSYRYPQAYSAGQVPADERIIVDADGSPLTLWNRGYIEQAWETSHLNGMEAGCNHMREGIDYTLPPASEMPERYGRPDEQGWKIANVVCAESGYRWGASWLVRVLDDELVSNLRFILTSLPGRGETND